MSHIKKYNEFANINEKAIIRKRGQEYHIEKVKSNLGMTNLYYNESGILGANDNHIYWDDLLKLKDNISKS